MSWWRKDHLSSVLYNAQVFIWTPVVKKHSTFVLITTSQKHWKPESAQLFSSGTHKQNDTPLMRCHVTLRRGFLFSSPCCWCCRGGRQFTEQNCLGLKCITEKCECMCAYSYCNEFWSTLNLHFSWRWYDHVCGWHWDKSWQLRVINFLFPFADSRQLAALQNTSHSIPPHNSRKHLIALDTCFPRLLNAFTVMSRWLETSHFRV